MISIDARRVLRAAWDTPVVPAGAARGLIIGAERAGASERERQIQPGTPFFARPQLHTHVRDLVRHGLTGRYSSARSRSLTGL